jgi:hypothetical protein
VNGHVTCECRRQKTGQPPYLGTSVCPQGPQGVETLQPSLQPLHGAGVVKCGVRAIARDHGRVAKLDLQ